MKKITITLIVLFFLITLKSIAQTITTGDFNLSTTMGLEYSAKIQVSNSLVTLTLVGPDDIVARFGGDEFIFCFTNLKSQECAKQRLEAIKQVFDNNFCLEDKVVHSSCSIGVSMYPEDAQTAEDLISKADIVLYKSKEHQKGNVLFYSDDINQRVLYDFTLEEQLRQAIKKGELSIQYQPQICGRNEQIFGVEALCRWHNEKLGFVSPIDFIAVAEKIDLINDIGMFVINKACQDFKQLQLACHDKLFLSTFLTYFFAITYKKTDLWLPLIL